MAELKNKTGVHKFMAFVFLLGTTLGVLTEVLIMVLFVIPSFGLMLFQQQGLGMEEYSTLANMDVQYLLVSLIMFLLPMLFFVGVLIGVHIKFVMWYLRKVKNWLRFIFCKDR